MGKRSSYDPGVFCWIDLTTTDAEAARRFYQSVFGWGARTEDNGYVVFTQGDGEVAGAMTDADHPGGPVWNTHISVADVRATADQAVQLGGTLVHDVTEVGPAGSFAGIQDPTGARVWFWQPGEMHGATVVNEPGTWTWSELLTREPAAAAEFYGQLLGWTYEDPEGETEYRVIRHHGRQIGGIMRMPAAIPEAAPPSWESYFNVSDLEATLAAVKEAGGIQPMEIMEIPGVGRFTFCHDPQGASFIVLQAEEWDE